ncbi:hypothetical protein E5676_scaffold299G00700 [Cucumis melo var. makuwa]|uniref:Uncharacterized protein n=1 Tax=Cucumis melo var. makuwa TaxID=1194695 RepID=A0A5A7TSH2_CUCMM|nr:hypothetical protein E6C27_scaffold243G005640 [Cucumis melo var. makuwa]TYK13584.1 hypothetical protein E5676_scaffold299G00700 [Cucumis melo var. makuwa]
MWPRSEIRSNGQLLTMSAVICVNRVICHKGASNGIGKVNSQPCYGSGEGTSFNTLKAQTLVGNIFVGVPALIIDDQPTDEKMITFVSDDPEYGIILIDVPLEGVDVSPLPSQPMLESKDKMSYLRKGRQGREVYPRNCSPQLSNKDKGLREERDDRYIVPIHPEEVAGTKRCVHSEAQSTSDTMAVISCRGCIPTNAGG